VPGAHSQAKGKSSLTLLSVDRTNGQEVNAQPIIGGTRDRTPATIGRNLRKTTVPARPHAAAIDGRPGAPAVLDLIKISFARTGSIAIPLSHEIRAQLDGPNFAHLATLMPDRSPQSVPVWVGRENDRVLICTGEGSLKAKNSRRDPRVSLSIVDFHDPYREAQLRGRVVERRPDRDLKHMDPISLKYTGKPFSFRSPEGRVVLVIEFEKARYTRLPFEHTPPR
jgi:PPOX class probable F420-dependent enzyme